MTEKQIFNILLREGNSDENFDYPKLQGEAVTIIAKSLTNIIYESLKQKSSASNYKRGNVLKFLNSISEIKEPHSIDDIEKYILKIRESICRCSIDDADIEKLLGECNVELTNYSSRNFTENVIKFHAMKNERQKKKMKCIEFVKERDQERIRGKYDIQIVKKISYYETNENVIRNLMDRYSQISNKVKQRTISETPDYREKQIKLAYALINMKSKGDDILEKILHRLCSYETLENYEQNFLQDLYAREIPVSILERIILKNATDLLSMENDTDVCQYFIKLNEDENFMRLRNICQNNNLIHFRLKTLIYELFCMSYCNENILKLSNSIK